MVVLYAKKSSWRFVSLHYKTVAMQNKGQKDRTDQVSHGFALEELLTYTDEAGMVKDMAPLFKHAELA